VGETPASDFCDGFTDLFCESFDGTSACYTGDETYVNCRKTWTLAGTVDFKETALKFAGTYSAYLDYYTTVSIRSTWTDQAHVYAKFPIKFTDITTSNITFGSIKDSGNVTHRCRLKIASGKFIIDDGADIAGSAGTTLSADTQYYIWVEYDGSGGDGSAICRGYLSTTDSRPETADSEFTTGANAGTVGMIAIIGSGNLKAVVDNISVKSAGW